MEVKVAFTSLQWRQPIIPRSLSSYIPPSSISFFSLTTHTRKNQALAYQFVHGSSLFVTSKSRYHILKQASNGANLHEFSDEEFSKQIEELEGDQNSSNMAFRTPFSPSWGGEFTRASIERKANSVGIPLSLRIIKKKQQWEEGLMREAKDYTHSSVNKAFSSMVFMIRELQRYALYIRGILYSEDLHETITMVQREVQASFVRLFQQVFSRTPILMVYLMILLANFTVFSIADNTTIAATPPAEISHATTIETVLVTETKNQEQPKLNSSTINKFSASSSIGGNNGSGGKVVPDDKMCVSLFGNDEIKEEEEASLWNSMVEEASKLQEELGDGVLLDHETMQWLVSPVSVELEEDDYLEYFKTELFYQMGLSQDPNCPLLLSNYAQFLFLVAHDYDRAEECFKRAVEMEPPPDAEALSRYANFLWMARKDLWGAEERYQQAMAAEPNNPYHSARYASFLWSTGGEDTCFLLNISYNNY